MAKYVEWPEGQSTPSNLRRNGRDIIVTDSQSGVDKSYPESRLRTATLAQLMRFNVFKVVRDNPDQNKTYTSEWVRDTENGIAHFQLTETGFISITLLANKAVSRLEAWYQTVSRGGVILTQGQNEYHFSTDSARMDALHSIGLNLLQTGATFPAAGIPWPTIEGQRINMNAVRWALLVAGYSQHFLQCQQAYGTHRTAIEALVAAENHQGLIDYDSSTGWPDNPDLSSPSTPE